MGSVVVRAASAISLGLSEPLRLMGSVVTVLLSGFCFILPRLSVSVCGGDADEQHPSCICQSNCARCFSCLLFRCDIPPHPLLLYCSLLTGHGCVVCLGSASWRRRIALYPSPSRRSSCIRHANFSFNSAIFYGNFSSFRCSFVCS